MPLTRAMDKRTENSFSPLQTLDDPSAPSTSEPPAVAHPSNNSDIESHVFTREQPPHLNSSHSRGRSLTRPLHCSRSHHRQRTQSPCCLPSRGPSPRSHDQNGFHPTAPTAYDWLTAMRDQQAFIRNQQLLQARQNRDMLASFQASIQTQLAASVRPTAVPPAAPAVPVPTASKMKLADPDRFEGDPQDIERFLNSVTNIFMAQPAAARWSDNLYRDLREGRFTFTTWEAFEDRFRETFGNPYAKKEAQQKLMSIIQGQQSAEDFFIEFDNLRHEADMGEEASVFAVCQAARPALIEAAARRDPEPTTYLKWKTAILQADQQARHNSTRHSLLPSAPPRFPLSRLNFRHRTSPSSTVASTGSVKPSYSQPSENVNPSSSTTSRPSTSSQPPTTRKCWGCGDFGHYSKDCKKKKFNDRMRAVLEHIDGLDDAYETLTTNAETIRKFAVEEPESNSEEGEIRRVNGTSSSDMICVDTLHQHATPSLQIVPPPFKHHPATCVEVPDREAHKNRTRNPTANGELLYSVHDEPPPPPSHVHAPSPSIPCMHKLRVPAEQKVLEQIRCLPSSSPKIKDILVRWAHAGRQPEIDDSLIRSILFLDEHLSLQILRQLKEPKAQLQGVGVGDYKDWSLVLPIHLSSLDGRIEVLEKEGLVDCGASGRSRGYIDNKFVDDRNLPTTSLPHPIAVYNVDGSLNRDGAITRTCTFDMRIGDHAERIEFRVTNTGSSNVILGLGWLGHHNPLVDWKLGKLFFTRCPIECGIDAPSATPLVSHPCNLLEDKTHNLTSPTNAGPDVENIRCTREDPCPTDDEVEAEWWEILCHELHGNSESMLCVDLNARSVADPTDPWDFAPIFAKAEFDQLPPKRPWDHAIKLKPDAKPISSKIYPLSRAEQVELDRFIEEHLLSGRIRPSKSPIASPFFFVKKKDGSLRPVQDYRRLNDMTVKNRYPLLLVSELMDKLKGAKYFTKLDIRWGYNNIRIKEGDEHKAAFITNRGLFEPLVMFFGLMNSPVTFQNMMNDLFRELLLTGHVIIYMDDILIFSDDLTTHCILTRQVLKVLEDNKLYLKPEKCVFEALEVKYLGVIVSHGCLKMDPKKVDAVSNWPKPHNKKDVQQFLEFVNFQYFTALHRIRSIPIR
ncbi:hypothetical protein CVT26_013080, partial [Gymnopilus dilepis]